MQSWSELLNIVKEVLGDESATTVRKAKRDLNIATNYMLSAMGRKTTHLVRTTNIVANQQYYQLPENCFRVVEAWIEENGNKTVLTDVESEREWNYLTSNNVSAATSPQSFHIRGDDQIGVFPLPSRAISNGLYVSYEPSQVPMQFDDYTTGTVAVTQGSQTVVGTGTVFTQAMVGRAFKLDADGQFYKISARTDNEHITIENYYAGDSDMGAFTIGQVPNLPAQFHDNLADYALFRAWQRRKDRQNAGDFKALWDEALIQVKEQYSKSTGGAVVNARPRTNPRDLFTGRPSAVL